MLKPSLFGAVFLIAVLAGTAKAQDQAEAVRQGAQAYRICAACHSLQPGVHLSGPSLADRWGKEAATVDDYGRYTEALKNSGIIWEENALDGWLAEPQAMVPGTTMTFRGVDEDATRRNLIAFLRQALAPGGSQKVVRDGLIPESMAAGQIPPDVSAVEENQRIKEIRHCRDGYFVTTADGAQFPFWETNVRIKIDTSPRGPKPGEPVLLRSGMVGDRVSVVFSSLEEMKRLIDEQC